MWQAVHCFGGEKSINSLQKMIDLAPNSPDVQSQDAIVERFWGILNHQIKHGFQGLDPELAGIDDLNELYRSRMVTYEYGQEVQHPFSSVLHNPYPITLPKWHKYGPQHQEYNRLFGFDDHRLRLRGKTGDDIRDMRIDMVLDQIFPFDAQPKNPFYKYKANSLNSLSFRRHLDNQLRGVTAPQDPEAIRQAENLIFEHLVRDVDIAGNTSALRRHMAIYALGVLGLENGPPCFEEIARGVLSRLIDDDRLPTLGLPRLTDIQVTGIKSGWFQEMASRVDKRNGSLTIPYLRYAARHDRPSLDVLDVEEVVNLLSAAANELENKTPFDDFETLVSTDADYAEALALTSLRLDLDFTADDSNHGLYGFRAIPAAVQALAIKKQRLSTSPNSSDGMRDLIMLMMGVPEPTTPSDTNHARQRARRTL